MNEISRRNFLKSVGVAGLVSIDNSMLPSWMPRMVFSPPERQANAHRDTLVVIFQRGGMDALNAVIPFGEGRFYYDQRPTLSIPEPGSTEQAALDLDGFFGFHPALQTLKQIYDYGALTVVHSVGLPTSNRSHFAAMESMERGTVDANISHEGWVNRHLLTAPWENLSPLRAVGIGALIPSSMQGTVSALALKSITDFHLKGLPNQVNKVQKTLSTLYNTQTPTDNLSVGAANVFSTVEMIKRINAQNYKPANGAVYPVTEYGMGLKQIAQLIKANVGLEVACIDIGGWDTHQRQGSTQGLFATLLDEFGKGLTAFYVDLFDYMANVTVITMSEFGRRLKENASSGTDHGRGGAMLIMGGGAHKQVYTDWPGLEEDALEDGDLRVTVDYRDVLSEILINRLGNPSIDQIFPNYTQNLPGIINSRF